jgi:hypothetical protein
MKSLRKFFPELWQKMLKLESEIPEPLYSRGFQCGKTLKMFDDRFAENDRQLCLFGAA